MPSGPTSEVRRAPFRGPRPPVIAEPSAGLAPKPVEQQRREEAVREIEELQSLITYRKRYLFNKRREAALQEALRSGAISREDLR